jgi:hypothetical protein
MIVVLLLLAGYFASRSSKCSFVVDVCIVWFVAATFGSSHLCRFAAAIFKHFRAAFRAAF